MTETIVNPQSGRAYRSEQLLSCLMDWTTEQPIIAAMYRAKLATPAEMIELGLMVKVTEETGGEMGLTDEGLAVALGRFLVSSKVRRVIARHVSRAHGIKYLVALRDLKDMRKELEA